MRELNLDDVTDVKLSPLDSFALALLHGVLGNEEADIAAYVERAYEAAMHCVRVRRNYGVTHEFEEQTLREERVHTNMVDASNRIPRSAQDSRNNTFRLLEDVKWMTHDETEIRSRLMATSFPVEERNTLFHLGLMVRDKGDRDTKTQPVEYESQQEYGDLVYDGFTALLGLYTLKPPIQRVVVDKEVFLRM